MAINNNSNCSADAAAAISAIATKYILDKIFKELDKNLTEYDNMCKETQELINADELYRKYDSSGNVEAAMDEFALDYWSKGEYDRLVSRADYHQSVINGYRLNGVSTEHTSASEKGARELKYIAYRLRSISKTAFEAYECYEKLSDLKEYLISELCIYGFNYLETKYGAAEETMSRGFNEFKKYLKLEKCIKSRAYPDYREDRHLIFVRETISGKEYIDVCMQPIFDGEHASYELNAKITASPNIESLITEKELDDILSKFKKNKVSVI